VRSTDSLVKIEKWVTNRDGASKVSEEVENYRVENVIMVVSWGIYMLS